MIRVCALLLLISSLLTAQDADSLTQQMPMDDRPLFLNVVLPESDTVRNTPSRYRIAASTNVTSRAFINGEEHIPPATRGKPESDILRVRPGQRGHGVRAAAGRRGAAAPGQLWWYVRRHAFGRIWHINVHLWTPEFHTVRQI